MNITAKILVTPHFSLAPGIFSKDTLLLPITPVPSNDAFELEQNARHLGNSVLYGPYQIKSHKPV